MVEDSSFSEKLENFDDILKELKKSSEKVEEDIKSLTDKQREEVDNILDLRAPENTEEEIRIVEGKNPLQIKYLFIETYRNGKRLSWQSLKSVIKFGLESEDVELINLVIKTIGYHYLSIKLIIEHGNEDYIAKLIAVKEKIICPLDIEFNKNIINLKSKRLTNLLVQKLGISLFQEEDLSLAIWELRNEEENGDKWGYELVELMVGKYGMHLTEGTTNEILESEDENLGRLLFTAKGMDYERVAEYFKSREGKGGGGGGGFHGG
ncbi:MAG: hypothetical protein N4A38_02075 [Candidatus Gracilibacteria bacterium]|nr:hypothetical protein [Candidatus Gracilibacteria bacterium]